MKFGLLSDLLAGLAAAAAGAYLLLHHGALVDVGGQQGQSWFEVLAHGIGVYFVAKGVYMIRSGWKSEGMLRALVHIASHTSSNPGTTKGAPPA